jgi:NitT/TauT family transport system substrate-binding protein
MLLTAGCAVTVALAACGSSGGAVVSGSSSPAAGLKAAAGLKPFDVAVVPTLAVEPLYLAVQRGYFKKAGLDVQISTVDSGPALLTGVINGTYQAGYIALFPALIAASKGAHLKMLLSSDAILPPPGANNQTYGAQSALIVPKGSPIKNYRDLAGKTVATNALTSLTTLAVKIAIAKQGGNPNAMKVISLPFNDAIQEVARGQVDAAIVLAPFSTEAVLDGLQNIGAPIETMMPGGAPAALYFTSAQTASSKAGEVAAFQKVMTQAETDLQKDPALERQLAHTVLGYSAKLAQIVPLPYLTTKFSLTATQQYADLVAKYGYTSTPVNAKDFPG